MPRQMTLSGNYTRLCQLYAVRIARRVVRHADSAIIGTLAEMCNWSNSVNTTSDQWRRRELWRRARCACADNARIEQVRIIFMSVISTSEEGRRARGSPSCREQRGRRWRGRLGCHQIAVLHAKHG